MATIDELKARIDLHDLADFLRLVRPGSKGNYKSPHHDDKSPSLQIGTKAGSDKWRDYSGGPDAGGSCIDLVCYVRGVDVAEAIRILHEEYLHIPMDKPDRKEERRPQSMPEYIAEKCMANADKVIEYLKGRGIAEAVIKHAISKRSLGFNEWESDKVAEGQPGHGGPAAAFIVRTLNPGHVVAVDMRFVNPSINGNVKTQCQGEKDGYGWTSDIRRLQNAKTVYIVESPINALSIECCELRNTAVYAIRGTSNAYDRGQSMDWSWLKGKKAVICLDNDPPQPEEQNGRPNPNAGMRPGQEAAWALHERLTSMDIAAMIIDQSDWKDEDGEPINDVNDLLQHKGVDGLRRVLWKLEPWIIQGLPGKEEDNFIGRKRLYLPYHDQIKYWRYRVREDFTSFISEVKKDDAGNESFEYQDLAGFRIASLSRVTIASATATMSGDPDNQAKTLFAISVQTARHGANLIRRVVEDEKLHNVDTWKKIGPVFNQAAFLRMVNILERGADIGSRNAANFVGLCYKNGKLVVNEGPDCYFTQPDQQCPYHNLTFPTGSRQDARSIIDAYQNTFKSNAAAIPLVWALGGHLKVLLGFWPHMQIQADKGAGKSTLIKRLERTIGFTMFSGQSLQTEFRLLTSISHTSHPVGWEELSARRQDIIDKAVGILQENYQYTVNRRGADMTEFLLSAPVMLAGEDVPVRSLIGKIVRTELTGKKGPMMPDDLPRFPVRQWIEFLTGLDRGQVLQAYEKVKEHCLKNSAASGEDDGAVRMAGNYAAVITAWRFLCEFAEVDYTHGNFMRDVIAEMNAHITETSSDREPWVWILETILSEIASHEFKHPHKWDWVDNKECLLVRTGHMMDHLASKPALRDKWNSLPVKSDRVFKKQLKSAGVILSDDNERTIGNRRVSHLCALDLKEMEKYGLVATPSKDSGYD